MRWFLIRMGLLLVVHPKAKIAKINPMFFFFQNSKFLFLAYSYHVVEVFIKIIIQCSPLAFASRYIPYMLGTSCIYHTCNNHLSLCNGSFHFSFSFLYILIVHCILWHAKSKIKIKFLYIY